MNRPANPLLLPFVAACVGIAFFSTMDGLMKGLSLAVGAYNAMLWRLIVGAVLAGALFAVRRETLPARSTLKLHVIRATVSSGMAVTFFWGIARVPLAEGIALSFIAPLITLYLAAILLGETISRRAIIASLLGVAGVIVILAGRIGGAQYDEAALQGVGAIFLSALLYSYNLILQRQQAQVASPVEVAFFQSLIAGCVLGLGAPFLAVVPQATLWPSIFGSALLAIISLMLLSWAYARAEAQILVSVEYTAFIWAMLVGWLLFEEPVTGPTLLGAVLIIAGCLYAARGQKGAPPPAEITAL
jgi:S-adenosylmethionine uptake transporter